MKDKESYQEWEDNLTELMLDWRNAEMGTEFVNLETEIFKQVRDRLDKAREEGRKEGKREMYEMHKDMSNLLKE